jgi:hypothetical protein
MMTERENEIRGQLVQPTTANRTHNDGRSAQEQLHQLLTEREAELRNRLLQPPIRRRQPTTNGEVIYISSDSENDDDEDSDDANSQSNEGAFQQEGDDQLTSGEYWTSDDENSESDEEHWETESDGEVFAGPACFRYG